MSLVYTGISKCFCVNIIEKDEPEFWLDTVRNWIVRNDPFSGQNDSNSYYTLIN